ncbi:MAG: MarR family winged helix-turn-helix transcriptional regulator [Gemmatimonadales bacterium]
MPASRSHRPARRTAVASVSALDSHLGFWLRFVSNHVSAGFRRRVEASGVSVAEWVALRTLYDSGQGSPGMLVAALGMTKGAVSKVVDRLEAKGLVRQRPSREDGRARDVILTEKGRALVPRLAQLANENDAAFFGHLSAARRAQLTALLRSLVKHHGLEQVPVE